MPDVTGLPDLEAEIFSTLRMQIEAKRARNELREAHYDATVRIKHMGIAVPQQFHHLEVVAGWAAKAVDVLASRIQLNGFVTPSSAEANSEFMELFNRNHMQLQFPAAVNSMLIHSCAFIETSGSRDATRLLTYPATQATGRWSHRLQGLDYALVVSDTDKRDRPIQWVLSSPEFEWTIDATQGRYRVVEVGRHNLGMNPVEVLPYKPRITKPFGKSRISRAVINAVEGAARTVLRAELNAEIYSTAYRYILDAPEDFGEDENGKPIPGWLMAMDQMFTIRTDPDDPEAKTPTVGSFTQPSQQPHLQHLEMWAKIYAGETGVPIGELGIVQDNPESAEALKLRGQVLTQAGEAQQRVMDLPMVRSAQKAWMIQNGTNELPSDLVNLRGLWRDASVPTKMSAANNVMSLVSANILPARSRVTWEALDMDETSIERLLADTRRDVALRDREQPEKAASQGMNSVVAE